MCPEYIKYTLQISLIIGTIYYKNIFDTYKLEDPFESLQHRKGEGVMPTLKKHTAMQTVPLIRLLSSSARGEEQCTPNVVCRQIMVVHRAGTSWHAGQVTLGITRLKTGAQ